MPVSIRIEMNGMLFKIPYITRSHLFFSFLMNWLNSYVKYVKNPSEFIWKVNLLFFLLIFACEIHFTSQIILLVNRNDSRGILFWSAQEIPKDKFHLLHTRVCMLLLIAVEPKRDSLGRTIFMSFLQIWFLCIPLFAYLFFFPLISYFTFYVGRTHIFFFFITLTFFSF